MTTLLTIVVNSAAPSSPANDSGMTRGVRVPGAGLRASWSIENTCRHSHRSTCERVGRVPPTNGSGSFPPVVIGTRIG